MSTTFTLLSSPFPSTDEERTLLERLSEAERSKEWWKQRVGVLDLRCREINSQLRDALVENRRYASIPVPEIRSPKLLPCSSRLWICSCSHPWADIRTTAARKYFPWHHCGSLILILIAGSTMLKDHGALHA